MLVRNLLIATVFVGLSAVSHGADESPPCVLDLRDDNFVRGSLAKIEDGTATWNSPYFTTPLTFPLDQIIGLKFESDGDRVQPAGDFLIELNNRDTFYGSVLSIDEESFEIESASLGRLSLHRDAIRRISRNGPEMKLYPVPSELDEWTMSNSEHWRSEGNSFVTDAKRASLFADLDLPDKCVIEMDLAWSKKNAEKPSFSIYLGTEESAASRKAAFSIEVWESFAVAQRQSKDDADLASLKEMGVGSMHLFAYLDRPSDRLIIYDASGKQLADLHVPVKKWLGSGVMFLNRSGQFRINFLQVRGWSGAKPNAKTADPITVASNKESIGGDDLRVDDGLLTLTTESGDDEELAIDDVDQIDFSTSPVSKKSQFVAGYQDGSRISGELLGADNETLTVQIEACDEPLKLSLGDLRGFALTSDEATTTTKSSPSGFRFGRLELMDTRLKGWFVSGTKPGGDSASSLTWKPATAVDPVTLRRDVFGRVVYREPVKPKKTVARQPNQNRRALMVFGGRPAQKPKKKKATPTKSARAVHLVSGDVIPCTVEKIDESGVHIKSTMTDAKLFPHSIVKAAQIIENAPVPLLTEEKRKRLLTLPRMQRNSPPQHLLFSRKGDVLRGSLLAMNSTDLQLEVRLNPHSVERNRVATIVWLHEDEMDGVAPKPKIEKQAADDERLMVQVVRNTGSRYSFYADSFKDQTIHGSSDILSSISVKVSEIDQLLLGGFIRSSAKSLAFGRWRLTPAIDPKFVTADESEDGGEASPGTESALVGKVAPDIKLVMLDESTDFELSDHRGHCVVLDFWATWCGPCLQVMPVVDEVVSEFEDKGVKLFAVNLEERPAEIKKTLERRQLDVAVVLDRDGVAAARYEANAIPQTVVIGPDGKIARIFVGSSRKFADQLRSALEELTN